MVLHELIAERRKETMKRWESQVRVTLAPDGMSPLELADHLPKFLGEILSALRTAAGLSPEGPTPDASTTAAGHGEQRLRLGFSLDALVREYGALRDAIVSTALDAGVHITIPEMQIVSDSIIGGIAQAVSEYTHQRDAELHRQANEHFAFIAHELRGPLSSARTAFEVLKVKGQLPTDSRAVLALGRSLQRTGELIDQTLQIARVASGIDLRKRATTVKALLDEAELGAMTEAEGKNITLRVVLKEDGRVNVDERLVGSALGNLIRNGVKYSPSGSSVELRGQLSNGHVVLEVEDSCGGLPPGKVEEAFAPFVRLDSRQTGFGLGLAIAKQAVDAHSGTIRVQNLPGKGCIFVLELPVG